MHGNYWVFRRLISTPVGDLVAVADDSALLMLEFAGTGRENSGQFRAIQNQSERNPVLESIQRELAAYFDGDLKEFETPIRLRGTPFQEAVWRELLKIPYGHTRSYVDIARILGSELKTRAVGGANGRNCLAIIVPCHRVINADGKLGGYGGTLPVKKRLLDLEAGALRLL
jgi:AraC family transcriptional regulator of adaptative response/methylated-DNA-[protein]-cysteine methyltransferase